MSAPRSPLLGQSLLNSQAISNRITYGKRVSFGFFVRVNTLTQGQAPGFRLSKEMSMDTLALWQLCILLLF